MYFTSKLDESRHVPLNENFRFHSLKITALEIGRDIDSDGDSSVSFKDNLDLLPVISVMCEQNLKK
jgi:hypothetical protein